MSMQFDFRPDAERARRIDRRMHAALASSLRHICEQGHGVLNFDEAALTTLIQRLETGVRHRPAVFGAYYDLVRSLIDGDHVLAERLFGELASARPCVVQTVRGLQDVDDPERYQRLMTAQEGGQISFLAPSADIAASFRKRYDDGLSLLKAAVPELAGEVQAIINEVIAVVGDARSPMAFDGGSHYQLWGALFLNAEERHSPYAMAEVVAHESAHSLLFGFSIDEPLVQNDESELYKSPLRSDPRPMDGVYHATFVSARMHWTMSRLAASPLLDQTAREEVASARDLDRECFEAGYGVVARHARMTATGAALMQGARAYMTQA